MRFLLYLLTFFLTACSNEESMIKNFIQDNNLPFEEMKEVSLLETHDGKKKIDTISKSLRLVGDFLRLCQRLPGDFPETLQRHQRDSAEI